jgi:hypothetical protein
MTREQLGRLRTAAYALMVDEATWSTQSRHEVVADASHYIQFDRPDLVISAVREVVASVRGGRSPESEQTPLTHVETSRTR